MLTLFDTTVQAPTRQFDCWRDALCRTFVDLAAERPATHGSGTGGFGTGGFGGRIRQFDLGPVGMTRVTADAHCVGRTRAEISRANDDRYFVNLQLSGTAKTSQSGVQKAATAGQMLLIDTREPFSVRHDAPFDLLSFMIPRGLLAPELGQRHPEALPLAANGQGRILRSFANAILEEAPDDLASAGNDLADNLIGLISSAINAATMGGPSGLGAQQVERLRAVQRYIEANLVNPDLSLACVVDRFNLSPRYLQKLFAATGTTFSQTLLARRLDKVASALRRQDLKGRSITETAYLYGFNDVSYFNRSFRKRFGSSPRDYRATVPIR